MERRTSDRRGHWPISTSDTRGARFDEFLASAGVIVRIIRTRVRREGGSDVRQRKNVGKVLTIDERPAHVAPAVSGKRSQARLGAATTTVVAQPDRRIVA